LVMLAFAMLAIIRHHANQPWLFSGSGVM
jgi:SRSO17 transposase